MINLPLIPGSVSWARKAAWLQHPWVHRMERGERRATALWYWRTAPKIAASWPEFWRLINANNGVVP